MFLARTINSTIISGSEPPDLDRPGRLPLWPRVRGRLKTVQGGDKMTLSGLLSAAHDDHATRLFTVLFRNKLRIPLEGTYSWEREM